MVSGLRAIVVGPGFIGSVHADALRRNGVEVVGFVGSGSEVGRQRAEAFGCSFFPSLAEALAETEVDRVHIAKPNHPHAPLAEEAIAAGDRPAETDSPTFADGVRSLGLGDVTAASSRERRWVFSDLVIAP